MIKSFRLADLTSYDKKIYNYRLSRAIRIVENVFGILASRFRIFHTEINIEPKRIESVVMACCTLHNYLTEANSVPYILPESYDRGNLDEGSTIYGLSSRNSAIIDLDRRHPGQQILQKKLEKTL
nr:unnamed protein product [Callosobruchus analis]